ncbi:MAG: hypothetical protein IJM76_06080 [Lachnospiraceae bacterium]|nr:hypothetical protein [Lachnospiraceae bacterium]
MGNVVPKQADMVLGYMEKHGAITALEAMTELGVMRLAARISEIKTKRRIPIKVSLKYVKNRYGEMTRVASYSIGGEE